MMPHTIRLGRCNWLLLFVVLQISFCMGCGSRTSTAPGESSADSTNAGGVVAAGMIRYEKSAGPSSDLTPYPYSAFQSSVPHDHDLLNQQLAANSATSVNSTEANLADAGTAGDAQSKNVWSLERDTGRDTYEMAADFELNWLENPSAHRGMSGSDDLIQDPRIVAADLNGAFVTTSKRPDYESLRLELKSSTTPGSATDTQGEESNGRRRPRARRNTRDTQNRAGEEVVRRFELIEKPLDDISVYDLRTGQVAGTFSGKVPVWCASALSPSGKHIIGAFHVPLQQLTITDEEVLREFEEYYLALYVWESGKADYSFRLPMTGFVRWCGFIGSEEIAVYVGKRQNDQLQFWNVTTGEMRAAIDLPYLGWGWPATERTGPAAFYQPSAYDPIVGVSPRGKYLAVLGRDKLLMVSNQTATIEGEILLDHPVTTSGSVHFSDDANSVAVYYELQRDRYVQSSIVLIDAGTGRKMVNRVLEGRQDGAIVWHSESEMIVADWKRLTASYVPIRGDFIQELKEVFPVRICDTGNVLSILVSRANGRAYAYSAGKLKVTERSQFEAVVPKDIATSEYKSSGREVFLDRSSIRKQDAEPCKAWVPIAIGPQTQWNFDSFTGEPLNVSIGKTTLGMFVERTIRPTGTLMNQTQFLQLDAQTGNAQGSPLDLRTWVPRSGAKATFPGAMSVDGSRIVVVDPYESSSIKVLNAQGEAMFRCKLLNGPIEWLGFLIDDTLLVYGDEQIMQVSLTQETATAMYVKMGYRAPVLLLTDHKTAVVPRGGIFEFFDATTGNVLGTLGSVSNVPILDFCISPDGQRLAASFAQATHELMAAKIPTTLMVWDLQTGGAVTQGIEFSELHRLAWLTPEHVCICGRKEATVFDLKLGAMTMTGTCSNTSIIRTGGHLWANSGNLAWKKIVPPAMFVKESASFRPDRRIVELGKTPISLEIKFDEYSLPGDYGSHVVPQLERLGYKMGANGLTLRVTAKVGPSGTHLDDTTTGPNKEVPLPLVYFTWQLLDQRQKAIFEWQTEGGFAYKESKFYKKSDEFSDKYVFKSQNPQREIVEEIIDKEAGLNDLPKDFPTFALETDEGLTVIPRRLSW